MDTASKKRYLRFLSTLSLRRATSAFWTAPSRPLFLSTLSLRRATYTTWLPAARQNVFLSTLSLRRATRRTYLQDAKQEFLSTLSLRRATYPITILVSIIEISIHALLAESDVLPKSNLRPSQFISIHALLAESDGLSYFYIIKITDFYPRSPCGERLFGIVRHT